MARKSPFAIDVEALRRCNAEVADYHEELAKHPGRLAEAKANVKNDPDNGEWLVKQEEQAFGETQRAVKRSYQTRQEYKVRVEDFIKSAEQRGLATDDAELKAQILLGKEELEKFEALPEK